MAFKNSNVKSKNNLGFTIVELLVVIVVIGILAAITIVSYTGATKKATEAGLTSDLSGAQKQLEMFKVENGKYPETTRCDIPDSNINKCVKPSSGNNYTYTAIPKTNPTQYTLENTKGNTNYIVGTNTPIKTIDLTEPTTCPSGFIPVPGSLTYATSGFCVMKYEAKRVGVTNVPISTAAGLPWTNISQNTAKANSPNVAGCTGCHLISEAEWMTIAQNVLSVSSNWSDGVVGSGYIYSGHGDNSPGNALVANSNDTLGYSGTNNSSGEIVIVNGLKGDTQRRTLTLTNGQVVWDMAGNVADMTSEQFADMQSLKYIDYITGYSGWLTYAFNNWNGVNDSGVLTIDPTPRGTGLNGSETWVYTNGVGAYMTGSDSAGLNVTMRSFQRGGTFRLGEKPGILTLDTNFVPTDAYSWFGFRVAAPAQ